MMKNKKIIVSILFLTILCVYFTLVNGWNFSQTSDFLNYYQEALNYKYYGKLNDKFVFLQAPGHPVTMSFWMTLLGSDSEKYLQRINVLQYVLTIGIVFLSTRILPLKLRILSIISLSICVSYVSLIGFLCAEFNFLFFFVIANYLLIRFIK